MSTALTTTQAKLAAIEPQFEALDAAGSNLRALVKADNRSPSHAIRQAAAMQTLRELLTPEVMAPIVAMQGSPLGFLTDKDKDGGYGVDVVRDCAIEAIGRGAACTGNRFNIISGRCYLTKNHFNEMLDQAIGPERWRMVHGLPKIQRGTVTRKERGTGKTIQFEGVLGATVDTLVKWMDKSGEWQEETLTHAIKGDDWATADSYTGKADRKCGAWLLAKVTGERVPEGEVDEIVMPVQGTDAPVTPGPTAGEKLAAKRGSSRVKPEAVTVEPATEVKPAAEPGPTAEQASDALKATGCPEGYILDFLTAKGKLPKGGTLKDAAPDLLAEIVARPGDLARATSAWMADRDERAAIEAEANQ